LELLSDLHERDRVYIETLPKQIETLPKQPQLLQRALALVEECGTVDEPARVRALLE
jgi:hypothetical protein